MRETESQSVSMQNNAGKGFANEGLLKWEQDRNSWRSVCSSKSTKTNHSQSVDVDVIIEHIFTNPGKTALPSPVPLPQMIDILVDFWESDGLYD